MCHLKWKIQYAWTLTCVQNEWKRRQCGGGVINIGHTFTFKVATAKYAHTTGDARVNVAVEKDLMRPP